MIYDTGPLFPPAPASDQKTGGIRNKMRLWQLEHEQFPQSEQDVNIESLGLTGPLENNFTLPAKKNGLAEAMYGAEYEDDDLGIIYPNQVEENNEGSDVHLRRGDLVEIWYTSSCLAHIALRKTNGVIRINSTSLAVFIRLIGDELQFLTHEGKIEAVWRNAVFQFAVPHFVPRAELAPIIPYLPNSILEEEDTVAASLLRDSVPSAVAAPLVKAMADFKQSADEVYRKHSDRLDKAYEIVAMEHTTHKTTTDIAKELLGDPSPAHIDQATLWAVHRCLIKTELGFRMNFKEHRRNNSLEVMGKVRAAQLLRVRSWVRDYQENVVSKAKAGLRPSQHVSQAHGDTNPIPQFLAKARGLIKESRKYRELTANGRIGPTNVYSDAKRNFRFSGDRRVNLSGFSDDEKILIDFLLAWCAQRYFKIASSLHAPGPQLLRATGLYENFALDQSAAFTFLQEINVVAPWETARFFNPTLAFRDYGNDVSKDAIRNEALNVAQRIEKDSMQSLRRDWGETDVFCIDHLGASEIDDGISVEVASDNDKEYWVHVHVANPTAFIPPHHPLGRYAAQEMSTVYLCDRTYAMLLGASQQFSLENGRPALTFSARLNADGETLEGKITPSIVRNVHHVTPEMISEALIHVEEDQTPRMRLNVGGNLPQQSPGHPDEARFTESQVKSLRLLHQLANARRSISRKKAPNFGTFSPYESKKIRISPRYWTHDGTQTLWKPLDHDPIISLESPPVFDPSAVIEKLEDRNNIEHVDIVGPMMILACEVAATWCSQRNIPLFYRGFVLTPDAMPSPKHQMQFTDEGVAAYFAKIAERTSMGKIVQQDTPIPHLFLGCEAYSQVTSPLRRYGDMVAHWQIESALRYEAETGKSLIGNPNEDDSYLALSRAEIKSQIINYDSRCKAIYRAQEDSTIHWVLQLMFRAHYFREAKLPKTWKIFVTGRLSKSLGTNCRMQGIIGELSQWTLLYDNDTTREAGDLQMGDWWECTLEDVNVFWRRITMNPVRLIERTAVPEHPSTGAEGIKSPGKAGLNWVTSDRRKVA